MRRVTAADALMLCLGILVIGTGILAVLIPPQSPQINQRVISWQSRDGWLTEVVDLSSVYHGQATFRRANGQYVETSMFTLEWSK